MTYCSWCWGPEIYVIPNAGLVQCEHVSSSKNNNIERSRQLLGHDRTWFSSKLRQLSCVTVIGWELVSSKLKRPVMSVLAKVIQHTVFVFPWHGLSNTTPNSNFLAGKVVFALLSVVETGLLADAVRPLEAEEKHFEVSGSTCSQKTAKS